MWCSGGISLLPGFHCCLRSVVKTDKLSSYVAQTEANFETAKNVIFLTSFLNSSGCDEVLKTLVLKARALCVF